MFSLKDAKDEIKRRLLRRLLKEGSYTTALEGVMVHRRDSAEIPRTCLFKPRFIYMAQGKKVAWQETQRITFGENVLMKVGIDAPCTSHIIDASPENQAWQ